MAQQEFQFEEPSNRAGGAERTPRRWNWREILAALCLLLGVLSITLILRHQRREHTQDAAIIAASARYNMPAALIKAVIWQESRFDPNAKGSAGEIGLMQISKLAAQEWAASQQLSSFDHFQLFDPAKNTLAGAWYLRKLIRRYRHTDNPLTYALADYNAGRSNVLRWIKGPAATQSAAFLDQIDFPATKLYVSSVLRRYQHYAKDPPMTALPPVQQPAQVRNL